MAVSECVCVCVCVSVCHPVWLSVCLFVFLSVFACACACACADACVCACKCVCAHGYTSIRVRTCTHIYMHTHTHTHKYAYSSSYTCPPTSLISSQQCTPFKGSLISFAWVWSLYKQGSFCKNNLYTNRALFIKEPSKGINCWEDIWEMGKVFNKKHPSPCP